MKPVHFAAPASAGFIFAKSQDVEAYQAHVVTVEPNRLPHGVPLELTTTIGARARQAYADRLPVTACPYPLDSAAGRSWQIEYHAAEMERLAEATT